MNLTYSKALTAVVRALGLQALARDTYYRLRRSQDGFFSCSVMGRTCRFRAGDAIEWRTVELAFVSERAILELLLSEVRKSDCFLDVGANLGMFSVFAAAFGSRVIACEPEPIALQRLMANRDANQVELQIISKALSDEEKEVSFALSAPHQISQTSHISEHGSHSVECISGDSLELHPNIVKIDVEGHEIHVLRGLHNSLDLCRLCVVEVHAGVDWKGVERELLGCDFTDFDELPGKLIARR